MRNTYNILSFLMSVTCTSMYPTIPTLLIQPLKKQEEEKENSRCFFTKLSYSSKDAGFAFFPSSSSSLSSLFSCYFFTSPIFCSFFGLFHAEEREIQHVAMLLLLSKRRARIEQRGRVVDHRAKRYRCTLYILQYIDIQIYIVCSEKSAREKREANGCQNRRFICLSVEGFESNNQLGFYE